MTIPTAALLEPTVVLAVAVTCSRSVLVSAPAKRHVVIIVTLHTVEQVLRLVDSILGQKIACQRLTRMSDYRILVQVSSAPEPTV